MLTRHTAILYSTRRVPTPDEHPAVLASRIEGLVEGVNAIRSDFHAHVTDDRDAQERLEAKLAETRELLIGLRAWILGGVAAASVLVPIISTAINRMIAH